MSQKTYSSPLTYTHSLFLSDINLNSPHKGLGSDTLSDAPEERGAAAVSPETLPPGLTEEEAEELRLELTKVNPHDVCLSSSVGLQNRSVDLMLRVFNYMLKKYISVVVIYL